MTARLLAYLARLGHALTVYGLARAGINPDHLTHPTDLEQE